MVASPCVVVRFAHCAIICLLDHYSADQQQF
jgi:hypothetical protein